MLLDFTDIKGYEKETLFIIGNGFDKSHKLNTAYSDFHEWLLKDHKRFVDQMESICTGSSELFEKEKMLNLLWTDFEQALGKIDAETVRQYLEELYANVTTDNAALKKAERTIHNVTDFVNKLILDWARSISISSVKRKYNISSESKYLSFNYTQVLEECYDIAPEQILHIHGKIIEEKVIVGCERDTERRPNNRNRDLRRYSKKINGVLDRFNKPVDEQIENNEDFFKALKNIKRVVVIGHSLSDIDRPYLEEVIKYVDREAHWHFSAFCQKDHDNIIDFANSFIDGVKAIDNRNLYIYNIDLLVEENDKGPVVKTEYPAMPNDKVLHLSTTPGVRRRITVKRKQ